MSKDRKLRGGFEHISGPIGDLMKVFEEMTVWADPGNWCERALEQVHELAQTETEEKVMAFLDQLFDGLADALVKRPERLEQLERFLSGCDLEQRGGWAADLYGSLWGEVDAALQKLMPPKGTVLH